MALLYKCFCGCVVATEFDSGTEGEYIRCNECGAVRQVVNLTLRGYRSYYENEYPKRRDHDYGHRRSHDIGVARQRIDYYKKNGIPIRGTVLDVGCGNAAFVEESVAAGADAVGVEIGPGETVYDRVYYEDFLDVHFPTDEFDIVTAHDFIEHVVDPVTNISEMHRVLKQGGRLHLEIPDFWTEDGAHHWKATEHLWMFRKEDALLLLEKAGFVDVSATKPIPSKILLVATKPTAKRTRILLPPGIGDGYWPLTKVESFCEVNKLGIPDVFSSGHGKDAGRSQPYIRMIPFVHAAGTIMHDDMSRWKPVWNEAYLRKGRTIFKNVETCDYFIAYNGVTAAGLPVEGCDTRYETRWEIPMFRSLRERKFGDAFRERHGDYILAYFVPHGMYKHWTNDVPQDAIGRMLVALSKATKMKIVLIGGHNDAGTGLHDHLLSALKGMVVDTTGKTTIEESFGMMRLAKGCVGFPSGITLMSINFHVPTALFWSPYFRQEFWSYFAMPASRGTWYQPISTRDKRACDKAVSHIVGCEDKSWGLERKGDFGPPVERLEIGPPTPNELQILRKLDGDVVETCDTKPQPVSDKARVRTPKKAVSPTNAKDDIVTVACVLRSGGDYTPDYVYKLQSMVKRQTTVKHHFVCLSDTPVDCEWVGLAYPYTGWHSKFELFRSDVLCGPTVYFDLDTIIVGNIDPLLRAAYTVGFGMLTSFRDPSTFASGIMVWNGVWDKVLTKFNALYAKTTHKDKKIRLRNRLPREDQTFMIEALRSEYRLVPESVNRHIGVCSYKHHCRSEGKPPDDVSIVCFHGHPRPHEAYDSWVMENWK